MQHVLFFTCNCLTGTDVNGCINRGSYTSAYKIQPFFLFFYLSFCRELPGVVQYLVKVDVFGPELIFFHDNSRSDLSCLENLTLAIKERFYNQILLSCLSGHKHSQYCSSTVCLSASLSLSFIGTFTSLRAFCLCFNCSMIKKCDKHSKLRYLQIETKRRD